MRLFLGIELPEGVKELIHEYLAPLRVTPKGWEDPHDYHITLLFIGESSSEDLERIKQDMEKINGNSFTLHLGPVEFFNRRVMFVSLLPSKEMLALKHEIDLYLGHWDKSKIRDFTAHITVKRFQRYEVEGLEKGLGRDLPLKQIPVKSLALFESKRDELNHKYHVIHQVPLG